MKNFYNLDVSFIILKVFEDQFLLAFWPLNKWALAAHRIFGTAYERQYPSIFLRHLIVPDSEKRWPFTDQLTKRVFSRCLVCC